MSWVLAGWYAMTASLAILYLTFITGVGVLVAAWAWSDMPEYGRPFYGMTPLRPDLRHVVVMEKVTGNIHHALTAPLGSHA